MRKNIYQLISEKICDPFTETERIVFLFEKEKIYYGESLMQFIDNNYFRNMKMRGTSLSISDLKEQLGLLSEVSLDGLLTYCEFIENIIYQYIEQGENDDERINQQIITIIDNLKCILDCTNHEITKLDDNTLIITEKNKAAAQAASLIDDSEKALKAIEYNHVGLKGDLHGKQSILKQLGDLVEPLLKSHVLKNSGYGQLEDDAGFLLNNCQIRHENKSGKNRKDFISQIDDDVLEEFYDKTYQALLMVIIANDQIEVSKEIKELKTQYKW